MTRFLDGPAVGVTLFLRRAPVYLRAVHDGNEWDALDQLDDQARSGERVVVYRLEGDPTWIHVNRGRHGGGMYRGGTYRVVDPQPPDEAIRSNTAWRAWVGEQVGQRIGENGEAAHVD